MQSATPVRCAEILELYRFNTWATERMLAATAQLSPEELTRDLHNSFPSIRDTLRHIVGADWVWLSRWQGTSPTELPKSRAALQHAEIVEWWQEIDAQRHAFLLTLNDAALDRIIAYTNFAGAHLAFPLWQMLRHVVNHGTYHRGQVMTMLRQLGHKAVPTDMILLYQELQQAQVNA